ncbi:MAG TPA: universal stress protein [Polyangiaceae bacterium]|nr:universal stress protein [Polyangiaceae bacterium]
MRTLMDRNTSGKFLILVEVDFSEHGPSVLQSAADLASTTPDAELHLVHAFGPAVRADQLRWFPALSDLTSIEDSDAAGAALLRIAASISLPDTRVCAHVHDGSATTVIAQLAEDIEADLVVVGNHDRAGVNRSCFGSVTEKLVRMAPCPVLIIRSKSVPSSEPIAPPCPACEASKRLTWGAHLRCLDHAPRRPGASTPHQTPSSFDRSA